jgi:hypothetical protein
MDNGHQKISLALREMYEAITPPIERHQELLPTYKYNVLYIIRHHIHPDLKSEYVMEKNQVRFGLLFRIVMNNKMMWFCQRQIISGYTYTFMIINPLKIIIMLFIRYVLNYDCMKKECPDEDKIEKILTTMVPSDRILKHQNCDWNYQHYSELV